MVKKECHVCKGNKIMKGLEELSVFIEKGMENGAEIVSNIFLMLLFVYRNSMIMEKKDVIKILEI